MLTQAVSQRCRALVHAAQGRQGKPLSAVPPDGYSSNGRSGVLEATMQFRILGPLEALEEGVAVDLGSQEDRMVLAVLLLDQGALVPTDLLAGALWGHDLPADANARIAAAVERLRTLLGDAVVLRQHSRGYRLAVAPEGVDRRLFLDAAAATRSALEQRDWAAMVSNAEAGLALWRGPLLDGLE